MTNCRSRLYGNNNNTGSPCSFKGHLCPRPLSAPCNISLLQSSTLFVLRFSYIVLEICWSTFLPTGRSPCNNRSRMIFRLLRNRSLTCDGWLRVRLVLFFHWQFYICFYIVWFQRFSKMSAISSIISSTVSSNNIRPWANNRFHLSFPPGFPSFSGIIRTAPPTSSTGSYFDPLL